MTTLLTGATGFVGANLLRSIQKTEDQEIHIFLRKTSNPWRIQDLISKVHVHHVNLANREEVKTQVSKIKPRRIFHMATYGGYSNQEDLAQIVATNFLGTANLLDACLESDFEYFINTGSSSEYGLKKEPMSEIAVLEPTTTYGVTKAAGTMYCQFTAKSHSAKAFTLRLFSPYGPLEDENRFIPYVAANCLRKKELQLSNPLFVRDFVFVEDVVEAYLKVAKEASHLACGEIFNVGSGHQHTLKEVVDIISNLTDYNRQPHWGTKTPRQPDSTERWEADIHKIQTQTGWKPKTSLEDGLVETIKWFKNNAIQ